MKKSEQPTNEREYTERRIADHTEIYQEMLAGPGNVQKLAKRFGRVKARFAGVRDTCEDLFPVDPNELEPMFKAAAILWAHKASLKEKGVDGPSYLRQSLQHAANVEQTFANYEKSLLIGRKEVLYKELGMKPNKEKLDESTEEARQATLLDYFTGAPNKKDLEKQLAKLNGGIDLRLVDDDEDDHGALERLALAS